MGEKEPHFFCDIVIPILKKYPEFKAVMIGEGSLKDELKKRFEEVSLTERVSFPGFLKFSEIAKYYKSSFLFIHSAFWEGWGLPMVESTCCGLPNITTDTGCAGEVVINNYNGIILNSKNASDYTNEIEKLIHDEAKYNLLVENCLKSGDEWTFKTMARKTETFLLLAQNKI
jgi:glycosyltransferase involved in cell wall biosynthesis